MLEPEAMHPCGFATFSSHIGFDLFEDPSTSLEECSNFNVTIDSELFGKIDVKLPCHQEFTLMFPAPDVHSAIVFQFADLYVINQVTFVAWPLVWDDDGGWAEGSMYANDLKNPYMYILEVSKDGSNWTTVIDHSICKCYYNQDLYFPRHATKYANVH
jgi:hypothetical protein